MKTLKIGMIALSILLILAGCKPSISTPVNEGDFIRNAQEDSAVTPHKFKVESVNFEQHGKTDDYIVTIEFSHKLKNDKETENGLKEGVKFFQLSNAAKAIDMPKLTDLTVESVNIADKFAYFKVKNLKDVKHLYMYIKADKVKDELGQKINRDEDRKYGEEFDDDYAIAKTKNDATKVYGVYDGSLTGNVDHDLNTGIAGNSIQTFPAIAAPTYEYGTKAELYTKKKIKIAETAGLSALFDSSEKKAKYDEIAGILNKHFQFEEYDWEKKEWKKINLTFTTNTATDGWTSDISVTPHRALQYKYVDLNGVTITSKLYKYPIKKLLKNTDDYVSASATVTEDKVSLSEKYNLKVSSITFVGSTAGQATLTYNWGDLLNAYFKDDVWNDVKVDNPKSGEKSLFKGFDKDTLVKDNFKFIGKAGTDAADKQLEIESIYVKSTDYTNYPDALNEVTFIFKDKNAKADRVYISPKVKAASFKGSYEKGGNKEPVEIPAMSFTNIEATGDINEQGGWSKLQ